MMTNKFFDLFIDFLISKEINHRTATRQVKWCCRFVRFHNKMHPEQMTQGHVNQFISYLRDDEYSQSSINEAIVSIRRMAEFVGKNIEIATRSTGGNYSQPVTLGKETIKRILADMPEPEATACWMIYTFGQNVGDIVKIRVDDYSDEILMIGERRMALSPKLRARFEKQVDYARWMGKHFVFFSNKGGHISQALIHSRLRSAARELEIVQPINARVLRASGIAHILAEPGGVAIVAELTGLNPRSIKRYLPRLDKTR